MNSDNNQIDFVITWVDPTDPAWIKEFNYYKFGNNFKTSNLDTGNARYRDWGLLRYWFRGVEKFTPWVRYIHFITYGHLPEWLNVDNPKLKIVRHEDYIPSQYLPLFNSNPIELMMHRIPDLAEHFVYFNDDFFIIRPISPNFFFQKGLPCDMAVISTTYATGVMRGITERNMQIIKKEFSLYTSIFRHWNNWIRAEYGKYLLLTIRGLLFNQIVNPGDTHAPTPYLKSVWEEAWNKYKKDLDITMMHRFRKEDDNSHWVIRYWQIMSGKIFPCNVMEKIRIFYNPEEKISQIIRVLEEERIPIIVLNDCDSITNFEQIKCNIIDSFSKILGSKSSFEKRPL